MITSHREKKNEDIDHDQDFHDQHGDTTKRGLTKDEVLAQGVLFFLAGLTQLPGPYRTLYILWR